MDVDMRVDVDTEVAVDTVVDVETRVDVVGDGVTLLTKMLALHVELEP